MRLIAGIDVGTSSVRVSLFAEDGSIVETVRSALGVSHPRPGWVEQDPLELAQTTIELVRRALDGVGRPADELAAIGIANQRATVVAWDRTDGRPLGPAVGWQDVRTLDRVEELVGLGLPLNTAASCTKLEWLVTEHPPSRSARADGTLRLGTVDTWLTWVLSGGGAYVTDPSNAGSTGLYAAAGGDWSDPALELFHLDRACLPDIVMSSEIVATTPESLLGAPVPLAARIGDQQAACFAHDMSQGSAKLTLGTAAMLDVGTGSQSVESPPGTYSLPLWRVGRGGEQVEEHCVEGSVLTAGAVIDWLVRVGLLAHPSALDVVADRGRHDEVFVPALAGMGTPHQEGSTRGLLAGIGLDTTAPDVVAAAVWGIAFRVAQLTRGLRVTATIPVDGGLSRSRRVLQSIADASGCGVAPATDHETTIRGAAMLAARAADAEPLAIGAARLGPAIEPTLDDDERRSRLEWFESAVATARELGGLR